ncbi:MAG TPA: DUF4870 domain-containing protein [Terriglobales bacterium]|jgi:uncharacterized membrane protein
MAFCSACGTQIPDGATVCPACSGRSAAAPAAVAAPAGAGMTDNVTGMLAYVTIIPAIIFLVTAPYNRSRFVRFHSFQCIFFCLAMIAIWIGLTIFAFVPILGLIMLPIHLLVWLGSIVLWVILLIKANQGQMWKLPIIGDMAEKQANAIPA